MTTTTKMAAPMGILRIHLKYGSVTRFFRIRRLSTQNEIRVRFAPSPTGMLHLGGLRTALFNYLFARRKGGVFVLRIEDTDQERRVPGAVEKLEDILHWAGIVQDEGPTVGGSYGPYIQSERIDLYKEQVDVLLKTGHCYRCFCTPKRLKLMKREAVKTGQIRGYDNKCRNLTDKEISENLDMKLPYTIRFKYEALEEPWTDMVYGKKLEKSVGQVLEGDFIIIKSDGYPTYHFANVVDDHFMKISHVLRGEEWSISTPKHLQMYAAFGWAPPEYGHLPLIMGKDGSKLSKRHGDVSVEGYRERGYEPEAVLNYLTTISGGFTEETAGKTLDEMVSLFSPEKILTHSSQLQPEKLEAVNRLHLLRRLNGPQKAGLFKEVKTVLSQHYQARLQKDSSVLTDESLERFLKLFLEEQRISNINELKDTSLEFYWIAPSTFNKEDISKKCNDSKTLITAVIDTLQNIEHFGETIVKEKLKTMCKDSGLKTKDFMYILRRLLTNQKEGPAINEMMNLLGKQQTIQRLKNFRNIL